MLDVAEAIVALRPAARGVARRPSAAPTSRHATTSNSSPTRWSSAGAGDGEPAVEYLPVTITRWPPGEAGLRRGIATDGRHDITLEVTRYRPEHGRRAAPSRSSTSRCARTGWCSTALNYIKDHLDGTLSFRWSCRMGICGSCGMMVNGEPKLTCATFLADYAPGPVRVEPLRQLPGDPRPRRRHRRLPAQAPDRSSRGSCARTRSRSPRASTCRRPQQLDDYKQFSMCINCMLCYSACPVYGLDPRLHRPGGDRAGRSATTSTRATRAPTTGWTSSSTTRASGTAPSSASAPGLPQGRRPGAARSSSTSSPRRCSR